MFSPTGTAWNQCMRNQPLLAVVCLCARFLMAHFFEGNYVTAKGLVAFQVSQNRAGEILVVPSDEKTAEVLVKSAS